MSFDTSYFEEALNYPDGYKYDEIRRAINQEYHALLRKRFIERENIRILDVGSNLSTIPWCIKFFYDDGYCGFAKH